MLLKNDAFLCFIYVFNFITGEIPNNWARQDNKTILLVSNPHSGHKTHLQGVMNFIFGVSSKDDFRLGLSSDITKKVSCKYKISL